MWFDERRRPRGLGASPAALLLALLAGLAAYGAAQQPTPTPLVGGASEDGQKINNLLIEYARDVRDVLHGGGDAEVALRHFDRSLGVWFEENFRRLAEFNTAMPGQPADDAARRRVAVDALCRYGPPMLSYRLDRIEFAGPRALLVLTETAATGNLTYYIPLRRDPTNRWRPAGAGAARRCAGQQPASSAVSRPVRLCHSVRGPLPVR